MNLKQRIDDYFFMSQEQQEDEDVEIGGGTYAWVLLVLITAIFGLSFAIKTLVQLH